jgi:ABC-type Mn2+/Zn2+ transport system ATPase subunit
MLSEATQRNSDAVLSVEHADLGYRNERVLTDACWTVRPGEFWFLLGPNGSGKTTLLRAILGLLEPLRGRVQRHPEHCATPRLGFVPQHCTVSPALPTTVREFVSLGSIGADGPRDALHENVRWALEHSGLAGMAKRDFWSLSGGQRQRALVARALVRRPSLIVLDEPTEGMDLGSESEFLTTLAELHRSAEATLIFVTHRAEIALGFATHIAIVSDGRLFAGPRDAVLRPEFLQQAGSWGEALRDYIERHRAADLPG